MKIGTDPPTITLSMFALGCGVCLGWLLRSRWRMKPVNCLAREPSSAEESFTDFGGAECKLVLVVRNDLKMGKGKAAAQCSHASVLAYKQALKSDPNISKLWERSGQRKVVVKVDDEETLLQLAAHSRNVGLITSIICDAGRTQIAAGSRTVLGVGPGPEALVDKVTGHLRLF